MIHSMRQVANGEFVCDDCGYRIIFMSAMMTVIEQSRATRCTVQHSYGQLVIDVKELEEILPMPEQWPREKRKTSGPESRK